MLRFRAKSGPQKDLKSLWEIFPGSFFHGHKIEGAITHRLKFVRSSVYLFKQDALF